MGGADDVTLVIDRKEVFDGTYVHVRAWRVPPSDRYPDGVKYSMQYGYANSTEATDGATDDGTIIRYDNFPDHPDASRHHKHLSDGSVEDVEFTGLRALFDRFRTEVTDTYGEPWN